MFAISILLDISFILLQDNEAKIHFDDESHIRVLHPDKFKHTEELAEQCTSFVESKTLVFDNLSNQPNAWLETMQLYSAAHALSNPDRNWDVETLQS